ncbi:hypothetical protein ACWCPF_21690 [Streptomyces sp. NPDC001858]
MSVQRLVFVGEVPSEAFARYAAEHGWELRDPEEESDSDFDEDFLRNLWRTGEGDVCHVDDLILGCQYVELENGLATAVADDIRRGFACCSRAEAVAAVDLGRGEEEVRRAFRLLAAVAVGDFDGDVFEVSSAGMRSPRSDIRESALIVPQRTNWTQFLPDVVTLHESDESADVRQIAGGIRMALEIMARLSGE